MSRLDDALRELGREHRQTSVPAHVSARAAAAFLPARREWGLGWMLVPAAAALALAIGVTPAPEPERLELRTWTPMAPNVALTPKRAAAAARLKKAPAREIASDFIPLRAGPLLEPGEMGQVLRTRVPRREARRFGLLMDGFGEGPDLPADVLVGWDGSARAVRLVHTASND